MRPEPAGCIDEIGNAIGRQHGRALDEDEMQAYAQIMQSPRARDRIRRCGSADHQTRRAQYALAMCGFDRFVDFVRQTKIVGRDDQLLQCMAPRRSRRNWKNSIPSRSRRFIMSGLLTISLTIDAILPERK